MVFSTSQIMIGPSCYPSVPSPNVHLWRVFVPKKLDFSPHPIKVCRKYVNQQSWFKDLDRLQKCIQQNGEKAFNVLFSSFAATLRDIWHADSAIAKFCGWLIDVWSSACVNAKWYIWKANMKTNRFGTHVASQVLQMPVQTSFKKTLSSCIF